MGFFLQNFTWGHISGRAHRDYGYSAYQVLHNLDIALKCDCKATGNCLGLSKHRLLSCLAKREELLKIKLSKCDQQCDEEIELVASGFPNRHFSH